MLIIITRVPHLYSGVLFSLLKKKTEKFILYIMSQNMIYDMNAKK